MLMAMILISTFVALQSVPTLTSVKTGAPLPARNQATLVKTTNGTGTGNTITITGLPAGCIAVVTYGNFTIVATGTSTGSPLTLTISPASIPQGWIIAYASSSPTWSYSGTVSPSYNYTLQGSAITATPLPAPLAGLRQAFLYGAPALSLIQVYQDTTLNVSAVKNPSSPYTILELAGMPFSGQIKITGAAASLNTDIKSGDTYAYAP